MRVTKKDIKFIGRYLEFVNAHLQTDSGRKWIWEMVERKNIYSSGAVAIVALTNDRELILERNWRVPTECFVIQLPAGLTDRKGESEEETAKRELLEETGYLAKRLVPIVTSPECAVLAPTRVKHFFAPDVEFTGRTKNDGETELIEVLKVPIEQLVDFFLHLPKDTILDIRVPGILWILEKKGLL